MRPMVVSLIWVWLHIFLEIDHEIFYLPLIQEYKRKYGHRVLVKPLFKTCLGKGMIRLTDGLDMAIADDRDIKTQTTQLLKLTFKFSTLAEGSCWNISWDIMDMSVSLTLFTKSSIT